MGENKHIKELDAFAKKYVKEIPQEKPSVDFTAMLMKNIVVEHQQKKIMATKPLIAKKVWVLLAFLFSALFFIPFKTSEKSFISFPKLDTSYFDKIQFTNVFESLSVSNITLYAILFFGLLFFAQIIFLKKHFDRKITN